MGILPGLGPTHSAYAQKAPLSSTFTCGAPELTRAQALSLLQQANLALQRKQATTGTAANAISYIPIRPHIIRRGDGTGGYSLDNLNQGIANANNYFLNNGSGIQFYFAGTTPDYIDDDALFGSFPYPEGNAVDGRDVNNAMNQYYVNQFSKFNIAGFAYYPYDNPRSTRSFVLSSTVVPHELGHNFNLIHTFGSSNGEYFTDELVTRGAGANCTEAGDLICDTPG